MKVMVFVKATEDSEKGLFPQPETNAMFEAMGKFNDELIKAGIMLAGEGLKPTSAAKRVHFDGADRTVTDGPFAETREALGSFFLIEARDRDEAVRIASMHPAARLNEHLGWGVEIRPIETCQVLAATGR